MDLQIVADAVIESSQQSRAMTGKTFNRLGGLSWIGVGAVAQIPEADPDAGPAT
jgi:hypothetical protein